jgi:hypothetical protein
LALVVSESCIQWDPVASDIQADPAATLALDQSAWIRIGARFRPVDDGQGECPTLATATVTTPGGTVEIGVVDYGEPHTFLLVPGRDPERADSVDAVVEALIASGALSEEQVVDVARGAAEPELAQRVGAVERRLAVLENGLRDGAGVEPDDSGAALPTSVAADAPRTDAPARVPGRHVSVTPIASLSTSDALKEHDSGPVLSIAFAGGGDAIAIAGRDGKIRLWSVAAIDEERVLQGHRGAVWAVAASAHEPLLASGGWDGTVRLWDLPDGSHRRLTGHKGWVGGVAFSQDGYAIASGGDDGTIRLWSVPEGVEQARLGHAGDYIVAVAFSPTGQTLASGSYGGRLRVWDRVTGVQEHLLEAQHGAVHAIAYSPRGSDVASANNDGTVSVWDVVNGAQRRILHGHRRAVTAVAFSPDGWALASGGNDGVVRVWDTESGALLGVIQAHVGAVRAVAYSPDQSMLASAGEDGVVRLWGPDKRTDVADTYVLGPGDRRGSDSRDR